jgi:hypothetical protein
LFSGLVLYLLTTASDFAIMLGMSAKLMLNERYILAENAFVEMVVWKLAAPLSTSHHSYKYRLALVVSGNCVVRYDNEIGKGDHKHIGDNETPYIFISPQALLDDFWNEVEKWRF